MRSEAILHVVCRLADIGSHGSGAFQPNPARSILSKHAFSSGARGAAIQRLRTGGGAARFQFERSEAPADHPAFASRSGDAGLARLRAAGRDDPAVARTAQAGNSAECCCVLSDTCGRRGTGSGAARSLDQTGGRYLRRQKFRRDRNCSLEVLTARKKRPSQLRRGPLPFAAINTSHREH